MSLLPPGELTPLGEPLLDTLERIGCGGIVLDASGDILQISARAERILSSTEPSRRGELKSDQARNALKGLLAAGTTRFKTAPGDAWIVVPRENARELIVHAVPIAEGPILSGPHTIVILIDLDEAPSLASRTLQKVFSLTLAEARLAARLATGATLAEIAEGLGVSMPTARSQLGSIFAKTHTRRQGELVALLARMAILP